MLNHHPRDENRAIRDLNAAHLDRQRYARMEHDQWIKDHPDFTSRELLDNWRRIREAWGLTQNTAKPKRNPA